MVPWLNAADSYRTAQSSSTDLPSVSQLHAGTRATSITHQIRYEDN